MSLFGASLKTLILSYEAHFTSIGFDFAKSAGLPDSLKVFVEGKVNAARDAATAAAGTDLLASLKLSAVEGKTAGEVIKAALDAKDASLGVFVDGLAAAGVKPAAQKDKPLAAADIKIAVEVRASQKGAAIAAAAGHEPIELPKGAAAESSAADLRARYSELMGTGKSVEASRFFDQHAAAMYPGNN